MFFPKKLQKTSGIFFSYCKHFISVLIGSWSLHDNFWQIHPSVFKRQWLSLKSLLHYFGLVQIQTGSNTSKGGLKKDLLASVSNRALQCVAKAQVDLSNSILQTPSECLQDIEVKVLNEC